MSDEGPAGGGEWRPRCVVVAIEDETTQAMVCVALEQGGFQPIASDGLAEAAELSARLPHDPLAVVLLASPTAADRPLDDVARAFRRQGVAASPTVLLHAPAPVRREPVGRVPLPDLAGMLRAVEALVVWPPVGGEG